MFSAAPTTTRRRCRILFSERERELRFAREFVSHEALSLHLGDAEPFVHFRQVHAHHELVAGHDRSSELDAVDAGEEKLLLRAAFVRRVGVEHDQPPDLRHGFHHQHTGHDRPLGKVTGEEVIVDGDVLQPDGVLALFDLDHAIDEKERVAVGKELHDGVDVHLHGKRLAQTLGGGADGGLFILRGEARDAAARGELRGAGNDGPASHRHGDPLRLGGSGRARGHNRCGARAGGGEGKHIY
mmetsp:Transcript_12022/g.39953  ORF Transcript_12022/g.39953 Transcript_12022/m.39953 type:complete len:241 (-) Transcript_12022:59-781(-)